MFIMFIPRIYCWEILLRVPPSPSPALPADSPQGDGSLRDDPEPYILETKPQRGQSREEIARRTSWARAQRTAELWAAAARSSPPPPPPHNRIPFAEESGVPQRGEETPAEAGAQAAAGLFSPPYEEEKIQRLAAKFRGITCGKTTRCRACADNTLRQRSAHNASAVLKYELGKETKRDGFGLKGTHLFSRSIYLFIN